jgi:hypothetical protein
MLADKVRRYALRDKDGVMNSLGDLDAVTAYVRGLILAAKSAFDPKTADRAFFMSLIDGTYPDLDDPELVNNLEAAYQRNSEDAEIVSLFSQAINAYTTASLAETEGM